MTWQTFSLRDVVESAQSGFASGEKSISEGFKHLRMNNIRADGRLDLSLVRTVPNELATVKYRLCKDDILVCTTNSGKLVGKSAMFSMGGDFAFSNHLTRLRVRREIAEPAFVQKQLWFKWLHGEIEPLCKHWVNQSTLPKEELLGLDVSLPDVDKQRHIVAKLDQIAVRVDDAKARLDTIPTTIKRFRQSILAAALSGRLTANWRLHQVAPISVDAMIANIKQRVLAQAKTAKNRVDIEERYAYSEERCGDDIPQEWRYAALDKLASFTYGTSAKSSKSGDVPVLRMGNLQNGVIDWKDLAYTSEAGEIEKYALKPMTVLFNRTNSPELVGKTSIYRGESPAIFAGYLIRINNEPELLPDYLNYCLNSSAARAWCNQVKTDGVSQSNINAQKLGKFEIPLCPLDEQAEIVRRVEALFRQADAIEARYQEARTFVEKLTPSVLAKAFRGELA